MTKKKKDEEVEEVEEVTEINDHNRNTEADTEQKEPLVDGAGNPVIGGVSVEKDKE